MGHWPISSNLCVMFRSALRCNGSFITYEEKPLFLKLYCFQREFLVSLCRSLHYEVATDTQSFTVPVPYSYRSRTGLVVFILPFGETRRVLVCYSGCRRHSVRSFFATGTPSYLLINRNKLPPWYSHCGIVCRFTAFEEIVFPSATPVYLSEWAMNGNKLRMGLVWFCDELLLNYYYFNHMIERNDLKLKSGVIMIWDCWGSKPKV